ncbi:uncharacterized protein LOC133870396 [Alnus glutinosa]|uniref:uncharacterized protein LOC133870396 n=1 Tax=Alnus glutinosa TaxID=3517 RepID=UPI002D7881A5|nr:uncharacterized protein LOC133870396 [Alnus glutinosa]
MMVGDEWVRAAMTDDAVVVELLVRLKQSQASSSSSPKSWPRALVPLRWGLRQPRSRPRCDAVLRRKEADSTRCSPTTPLSWSGGAPPSPTTDGFEASSGPASRSKGTAANESTATKMSRRKRTFAELKEQENSLLMERLHLKKEIATLRATFKEQSAKNESLKRMKLDLVLHSAKNLSASSDGLERAVSREPYQRVASTPDHISSSLPAYDTKDDNQESEPCKAVCLPDLNMMPSEEDSSSETLYGMS